MRDLKIDFRGLLTGAHARARSSCDVTGDKRPLLAAAAPRKVLRRKQFSLVCGSNLLRKCLVVVSQVVTTITGAKDVLTFAGTDSLLEIRSCCRRLSTWLGRIRRKDFVPNDNSRICSEHFEEACMERDLQSEFATAGSISYQRRRQRLLKPGSIPSLKLGRKQTSSATSTRTASSCFKKREHEEVSPVFVV